MIWRKLIPAPFLMVISILGITAFLLYWLQQTYNREEKSLFIKTEMAFRETIMQLQVNKLKLDGVQWNAKDSSTGNPKIIMHNSDGKQVSIRLNPKQEIISTINVIRGKLQDSLKKTPGGKPGMITITMKENSAVLGNDSLHIQRQIQGPQDNGGRMFNLLYGVDSLQDSLRLPEIDSAYAAALKKEKITIPFKILKADRANASDEFAFNEVTVGLANPVTYQLKTGNTFPYLLKQIIQPILFSFLLLGITILSFVLLYRNLLKQQRLAESKNEFISNITHELKTPIATVGVAIEALKNFNAIGNPQRTKEYLDISSNELQRLGLLVDKVLKLSMFEKKEVELSYETINLKEVVEEVVSSLKLQLEKNRVSITVSSAGDVHLQGDRLHMLSVFFNLVDNSIKYSREEPAIQIDLKEKEKEIIVQITDNGIGMDPAYTNKVFDKFFRIPHGDTHNVNGYGLGLSYTAQVIQKHQGKISVESERGKGSTFTIILPKTQNS